MKERRRLRKKKNLKKSSGNRATKSGEDPGSKSGEHPGSKSGEDPGDYSGGKHEKSPVQKNDWIL